MVSTVHASILVIQFPAGNVEPVSFDRYVLAFRTVGMFPRMPSNIPDIDGSQSLFPRHSAVLFESLHRRARQVHELVIGMESEEVDRHVRPTIIVKPATQLPRFVETIPNLRDDETRHLDLGL